MTPRDDVARLALSRPETTAADPFDALSFGLRTRVKVPLSQLC